MNLKEAVDREMPEGIGYVLLVFHKDSLPVYAWRVKM